MPKFRGHWRFALSLCAVLGLAMGEARAGSLTIIVTAADGVSTTITGGPLGTVSNGGNTLTITSIVALNSFLATNGTALQFNSLGASSDFAPGSGVASGSFVTQTGSLYYDTALTSDTGKVSVEVLQSGFLLPSGPTGTMQSSATANYTQAPSGSTETFTSVYNSALSALPLTTTSTGTAQNNYSPSNLTNIPLFVTPFELSNTTTFNILPNANAQATNQWTGSTTVTTAAIPEPASVVLMSMGMPLFLVVSAWMRRRRTALA